MLLPTRLTKPRSTYPETLSTRRSMSQAVAYQASQKNFSTYPVISAPGANATWLIQGDNVISWSGAARDSSSKYLVGIVDTSGNFVWPSAGTFDPVIPPTSSVTVGAGSLTSVGELLILVGIGDFVSISGAASGSEVVISGFTYVPIATTNQPSVVPVSVATTPATVTVGIGAPTQLTATATESDGSSKDITAQATWSSANTSIATVSATGVVTGVVTGKTTVSAHYAGFTGSTQVTVFAPVPSPPPPLSEAVAYQIDYGHSGGATVGASGPTFPPTASWSATLSGNSISYPVVAGGLVFVLTNASPSGLSDGTTLYALNVESGATAWGPTSISAATIFAAIAYDHGTLFVVDFNGVVTAFNGSTGATVWSLQLPATSQVTSAPTAVNGILYVTGDGGLFGLDESDGTVLFVSPLAADHSSPALSESAVFESNPCWVQAADPVSGVVLWNFSEGCSGGGGDTVAYSNNTVYARGIFDVSNSTTSNMSFDAATGKQIGVFKAGVIPAFSSTTGYFLYSGQLSAVDQTSGVTNWTFNGDGKLASAPLVIDGDVIIGSTTGNVYALSGSGALLWTGTAGGAIAPPDEHNDQLLTGFGVGDGYLIVPAGNVLTGWRLVP